MGQINIILLVFQEESHLGLKGKTEIHTCGVRRHVYIMLVMAPDGVDH